MNQRYLALPTLAFALASCGVTSVARHDASSFERARIDALRSLTVGSPSSTVVPVAVSTLPPPQQHSDSSGGWDGSIQGLFGGRQFEDDTFWTPIEDQVNFALEFEARPDDFPVGIEVGVGFSVGFEDDFQGTTTDLFGSASEVYVGPRFTVDAGIIRPYVATGILGLNARIDVQRDFAPDTDDSDGTVGGYVHGGVVFDLGGFLLGADIRHVYGTDIELFGVSGDADYLQVSLVLGGTF